MAQSPLLPGITLSIDPDASVATLTLWPDAEASSLNVETLTSAVRGQGVVVEDSVASVLEQGIAAFRAKPGQYEIVVSRAVPAVNGDDGSIAWADGYDPVGGAARAEEPAPGAAKVDYYSQTRYISVTAGKRIAMIRPATEGQHGRDVSGRVLRAKPGAPMQIRTDASVTIDTEGSVTAAIDGAINFHNNMLKVLPLLEVPGAVNFATGNIVFKGCVLIRGDVCDRFIVQATEDVTVFGLIGAATVICGRNLIAHCGMAAHERGCLYAGGDVQVGYMKNSRALVQGTLMARRELINCDVAVGGDLICDAGAVIGGAVAVGGKAVIGTLGSATGTPTVLVIGAHPCHKQIAEALESQSAGSGSPSKAASGSQVNAQLAAFADQVRGCVAQTTTSPGGAVKSAQLTIVKSLHPGVTIRCGRLRVVLAKLLRGPIHIRGDQQGLSYQMGDGVWHPLTDLSNPLGRTG